MITWPIAVVMIGGIASICLTILKIVSMRKESKPNEQLEKYNETNAKEHRDIAKVLTDAKERLIVMETKFNDHTEDEETELAEIKGQISKLTDIIIDVLKKIKMNDH
jgi:hypothetical protein